MKAVTYDTDSELAYIYVLPPKKNRNVRTEELRVNDCLLLDISHDGKIAGFECFGEAAHLCAPFAGKSRLYVKDSDGYHFRVCQHASVRSCYTVYGVTFCFSDGDYQEFAGFDLDGTMYLSAFLQRLTEK
ncbi:DUF2283 domain-containing protein [Bacillus subtilis]|uniref:DUF2283 domain-containing protein n=1 Tax=Bacillus TaxID=1386 RepID=UPI0005A45C5E|nr:MULTISPECIES: DUF2283 domain-containing protein [Bacillus]MBW4824882.1 DUF2283 domain-containing protein [Bacillaceae bacterium]AJO59563.1 hypothetical protein QF06_14235 [Bacillus sp. YP1]ASC00758.1 hypothetical protein CD007_16020 [Bacillus subtilis]AXF34472.1 DUF2283 domain-containing protein [Bacillus sp. DM2]KIO58207.1 hypothetical protein B4143_4218 [Bacillus subtilis]